MGCSLECTCQLSKKYWPKGWTDNHSLHIILIMYTVFVSPHNSERKHIHLIVLGES